MWTCSMLKQNAKNALSGRYWVCFAVCFLAAFLGGLISTTPPVQLNINFTEHGVTAGIDPDIARSLLELLYEMQRLGLLQVFLTMSVIFSILSLAFSIFVSNPIQAGLCRYMMESRQSRAPMGTLFSIFRTPYLNVVKVLLLRDLKVLLGTILFIVPGIIWHYQMYMVPYLMAENPYLTTRRAMELSKQMMQGEKWHTFVLSLSFIGWHLLSALTLGIGMWFLRPYLEATFAELYAALRTKAFAYGYTDESELGGFVDHEAERFQ